MIYVHILCTSVQKDPKSFELYRIWFLPDLLLGVLSSWMCWCIAVVFYYNVYFVLWIGCNSLQNMLHQDPLSQEGSYPHLDPHHQKQMMKTTCFCMLHCPTSQSWWDYHPLTVQIAAGLELSFTEKVKVKHPSNTSMEAWGGGEV
jgi:hypothetical protein